MLDYTTICLFLFMVAIIPNCVTKDGEWLCKSDGFWYQDGVKTQFSCKKDKSETDDSNKTKDKLQSCTNSADPNMPLTYPKTCIQAPPDGGLRCWWTHVPKAIKSFKLRVPLLIDMHGGGGCAHQQMQSSGFKDLADTLGTDTFITVWPQGYLNQWGSCGTEWRKCEEETEESKSIHNTDDIAFLTKLIAHLVKGQGKVDAQKIYATGFSMGCMMAQRLALEKSNIIAGFGCHGGNLNQIDSDLEAQKIRFNVQLMPAYMTGGSEDVWFNMAKIAFNAWSTWNGCSANTTTQVALPTSTSIKKNLIKSGKLTVARCGSALPTVEVVRFELTGAGHNPDARMAAYTWDFLKRYSRADALGRPQSDPGAVTSLSITVVPHGAVLILFIHLVVLYIFH